MIEREETQKKQLEKIYKTKFTTRLVDEALDRIEEERFFLRRHVYDMVVAYMFRYLWGDKMYDLEDE